MISSTSSLAVQTTSFKLIFESSTLFNDEVSEGFGWEYAFYLWENEFHDLYAVTVHARCVNKLRNEKASNATRELFAPAINFNDSSDDFLCC